MKRFYTSDTHIGHENSIQYCNRPFNNREEMDKAIVENWNNKVGKLDIVYHLGDAALGCSAEYARMIFKQLNGIIYLIKGSHDNNKAFAGIKDLFTKVYEKKLLRIPTGEFDKDGEPIHVPLFLDHYNHRVWPLSHYNSWHLFGHSHGGLNDMNLGKAFDIGMDSNDFTPMSEEDVIKCMNLLPNNFNFIDPDKRTKGSGRGICKCIMEPRGDNGLEGYALGDDYEFEMVSMHDNKGSFYRVYPPGGGPHLETCGPIVFKRFFSVVQLTVNIVNNN